LIRVKALAHKSGIMRSGGPGRWPAAGVRVMCFTLAASTGMVALGGVATLVSLRRGAPAAIPLTLAYFTLMEALQVGGTLTIDQCDNPVNQTTTWLSVLHIAFQPLFINAFVLEVVGAEARARWWWPAMLLAGVAAAFTLLQIAPLPFAGSCVPGSVLCGSPVCTVSGEWHLAWEIPRNGMTVPLVAALGGIASFPGYIAAVFVLPLCYGAWRFVLFHALAGPIAANLLTDNPNEMPAIWCLFSIGIILAALSPRMWQIFGGEAGRQARHRNA
jgi:hypothetical protein